MSKVSQGKSYEREVERILVHDNWYVERTHPVYKFIGPGRVVTSRHDFWGLFDILAVHQALPMRCAQVTVWEEIARKIKLFKQEETKMKAFSTLFFEPCIYARMRRGRNPHFRILYQRYDWKWKGDTALIVKT